LSAPADTITYLDRATVRRLLPSRVEQMDAIARTYVSMAHGRVENPPKIGVHPRSDAFVHVMPAYLRDDDVTGIKWVAAYPANPARGLPYISGLIVLNDSETGLPLAVMDAAEITAVRTAAASGVSIRHLAHEGWARVAILGFGEQGRQHAEVVRTLDPDAEITVYAGPRPRDPGPGIRLAPDARAAVEGADVVVTAGPMTRDDSRRLERDWLGERCLVVPVDFGAYVTADLVARADAFVVDDVEQFEHYRDLGHFQGWPEPESSLGAALGTEPHGDLRVSCSLGVGAIDAALTRLVWERARDEKVGVQLPR
jgi:ornithine cyclodeaminase/alanine dehydrogenase-like protein (mu-crystallin family)